MMTKNIAPYNKLAVIINQSKQMTVVKFVFLSYSIDGNL